MKTKIFVLAILSILLLSVIIADSKDEDSLVRKKDFEEYCTKHDKETLDILKQYKYDLLKDYYDAKDKLDNKYYWAIGICTTIIIGLFVFAYKEINKLKKHINEQKDELEKELTKQKDEFEKEFENTRIKLNRLVKKISPLEAEANILIDDLNKKKIDLTKLGEETKETKNKLKELSKNIEQREEIGEELTAEDYFYKGIEFYNKGDYINAIKEWDKAIEIKPDLHEAWNNKGNAFYELEKYKEAIKCYEKAIEIKPDLYKVWNNKGNALDELKRYEEAVKCYDKAIEINPDYHAAWNNKGNVLKKLKKYEDAIECCDKAIEIKPDLHEAWYNKGCAYSLLKNKKEMLINLKKAIELDEICKEKAKKDDDFKEYWDDPDFIELTK